MCITSTGKTSSGVLFRVVVKQLFHQHNKTTMIIISLSNIHELLSSIEICTTFTIKTALPQEVSLEALSDTVTLLQIHLRTYDHRVYSRLHLGKSASLIKPLSLLGLVSSSIPENKPFPLIRNDFSTGRRVMKCSFYASLVQRNT